MKRFKSIVLAPIVAILLVGFSVGAFAETSVGNDDYVSFSTLNTIILPEHSSYVSDQYFGVINVVVVDASVATATSDSQGHVVITGVGSGSTTVTYWYKALATDDWKKVKVPITVSSTATKVTTSSASGLVFPETAASIVTGNTYTVTGITNNGTSVDASGLLWVTPTNSVISVDASTGQVTAVSTGTAQLYAFDPKTNNAASITLTVY
ncbi:MAG TPA: hypothetical protein VHP54_07390 [Caproiciproducens sp.]|nr:hypothetical protein [Caproiciproducens sp.]